MKILSLISLLITSAPASASSTLFRGSARQGQDEPSNRHRRLLKESSCTLFREATMYEPTEDHPNGYVEDSWTCELSKQDAKRLDVQSVDIVESSSVAAILANATSGTSILTMSEAIVDNDTPKMYIPENAHVEVHSNFFGNKQSTMGKRKVLVIRLIDRNGIGTDLSVAQLENDVFDDDVSLKTQMKACSYGKLEIQPFQGETPKKKRFIDNGVVEVQMDYDITNMKDKESKKDMEGKARKAFEEQIAGLSDPSFDHVMFCVPPGPFSFLANASIGGKQSFYNNKRCGYVSYQMHEVGHNLGLDHSGLLNGDNSQKKEYGDRTGFMGYSYARDDQRLCYNPQKSFQLGWYDDKVETINPLDGIGSREFTLNGVSDYKRNNDALVVLRLEQEDKVDEDYYVGFIRAEGISLDVKQDKNMVTIVRRESNGKSKKVASLNPGDDPYTINDFNGQKDVQIEFLFLDDGDATIKVFAPTAPPTPSKAPTRAPIALPAPSNVPTRAPAGPTTSCENYIVQVTTDRYPEDSSWQFVGDNDESVAAKSSEYKEKKKFYEDSVCLPKGQTYEFRFFDEFGDGICCKFGDGSYRVLDDRGEVIVDSGGGNDDKFYTKTHMIETSQSPPTPKPNQPPTSKPCEDEKKAREKFRRKEKGGKKTCKFYAKKKKNCDKKIEIGVDQGRSVWEVCEKSCGRCSS